MFQTYKYSGPTRVRALQVTAEKVDEIARFLSGRVVRRNDEGEITGIEYPGGSGWVPLNSWFVWGTNDSFKIVEDEEFRAMYETAEV